ncbi:MAG: aspartate aminotransferase family protein, partial [Bacteroidales bacterium]|nr:aspartate aminotransferase family protein [Bacteroidales bacterium]
MRKKEVFPEKGWTGAELVEKLPVCKSDDARWDQGKIFGFVYHPGNYYAKLSEEYLHAFMYDSTLNPSTFPSLRNFEKDIVSMAVELMHGNRNVAGNVTTGGTESIFLALKVARDLACESCNENIQFEVILPETIHPAFLKACDYLSLKAILVPVGEDKRADPEAMSEAITDNTILICCSAPCFPYGVVDPVSRIGQIAKKHNILFHVDACMGGFMLPFIEEIGYAIPAFDFRIPGVTSISLDAHKYGYAPKGTSIILYRNRKLRMRQFFIHTDWSGGIFASTTFMGTKSGGPLAGCWAIMNHLGKEGYRTIAGEVMKTTVRIKEGIQNIESLRIIGDPDMSVLAFTSKNGDIYNIGDALASKGWHLDRLQFPDALHLTVTQLN